MKKKIRKIVQGILVVAILIAFVCLVSVYR